MERALQTYLEKDSPADSPQATAAAIHWIATFLPSPLSIHPDHNPETGERFDTKLLAKTATPVYKDYQALAMASLTQICVPA